MSELPEGWAGSPLEDVLETTIGGVWGGEAGSNEVDVDVLRVTELKANGRLEPSTAAKRSVTVKQVQSRSLRRGDIILEKSGGGPKSPVGRVGRITNSTEGFLFSNFMQLLRPDSDLALPNYLFEFLVYFQATGQTVPMQTATTNIRNIKMPEYLSIKVPLPPLPEQERIVEILEEQFSRLDAASASIRAVREKAGQFRRSLLHSAFSGELTGGTEGWREVALGEVCEYIRGVTYGKTDATDKPTEGFLPLLRATNIDDGRLVLSHFVFVPTSKVKPVQILLSGDLVMAASSGSIQVVGKSAPAPEGFIGTFGAFCAVLRPNHDTNHKYLNHFISSPKVREAWSAAARGTNINNLKREPVLGTQMPFPPLAEQERIVEILEEQFSRLDGVLAAADALEKRLSNMRRSILHAAFNGNLTTEWRQANG